MGTDTRVDESRPLFHQCAAAPGRLYERLRLAALNREDTGAFCRCGMTLVVPEYSAAGGQLWTVHRLRAPRRAGELALKDLLSELGVLSGLCGMAVVAEAKEALS